MADNYDSRVKYLILATYRWFYIEFFVDHTFVVHMGTNWLVIN